MPMKWLVSGSFSSSKRILLRNSALFLDFHLCYHKRSQSKPQDATSSFRSVALLHQPSIAAGSKDVA